MNQILTKRMIRRWKMVRDFKYAYSKFPIPEPPRIDEFRQLARDWVDGELKRDLNKKHKKLYDKFATRQRDELRQEILSNR